MSPNLGTGEIKPIMDLSISAHYALQEIQRINGQAIQLPGDYTARLEEESGEKVAKLENYLSMSRKLSTNEIRSIMFLSISANYAAEQKRWYEDRGIQLPKDCTEESGEKVAKLENYISYFLTP